MGEQELQHYLHQHIPLSKAMQVEVIAAGIDSVVLRAPLAPNINHRETVFGGSASALAILAAWSLVHLRLRSQGIAGRVVIRRNTIDYEHAMQGAFTASSFLGPDADWIRFVAMLKQYGMARISAGAELVSEGVNAGRFMGEFAALADAKSHRTT